MKKLEHLLITIVLFVSIVLATQFSGVLARPLAAGSDPGLGSAADASILSTTGVTNSGKSSTNRDGDVYPLSQLAAPSGLTVGGNWHSLME